MVSSRLPGLLALLLLPRAVPAYDLDESWSLAGVLAAAGQCQQVSGGASSSICRGGMPLQPEITFRPDDRNEFAVKMGFAAGNALGPVSPFAVATWAADLEDDVRHINGSGRSHLLTAWYRHSFDLGHEKLAHITAGIIDGADFLDENAYANDEYTQFMNAALVNGPSGYVPSYGTGTALEWDSGPWSLRGVYMRIDGPDADQTHDYLGLQGGFRVNARFGRGEYRLILQHSSADFPAAGGDGTAPLRAWIVSADQQLGDVIGVWARFGRQDNAAEVRFESVYSGGFCLQGRPWGRPADNVGLGLAVAHGGNMETDQLRVVELYYRAEVTAVMAVTADLQHVSERTAGSDVSTSGWIAGLRVTFTF
jgi:porin